MKIRLGFVSNSSSSSFIVRMPEKNGPFKDMYLESEVLIDQDIPKLLDHGFRPTKFRCPSQLEENTRAWKYTKPPKKLSKKVSQLGYCVICNEDEVIMFLVENNIPFSGSTHYGHRSVFFKRNDKTLLWMENLGFAFEMYGHGDRASTQFLVDHLKKIEPVRREPIKDYLKSTRELFNEDP